MISDPSNFRVQIWRLSVIMIRRSYRWICSHPFLLSFVGFLYFLHITCPLLFSLLVATSPVLVCTFILLGTILSFGELNIPEIGKESETVHEAAPLTPDVSRDATIVERGEKSFTVERFVSTAEKDVLDDVNRLGENQLSEVENDGRSFDYRPLVDETLDVIKRDTHVRFEEKAFVLELDKRGDRVEEKSSENVGKQVLDAEQSMKNSGSLDEVMGDSKEDQMDVSPISPWTLMRHEDDDADRDDSLDSESDGSESSSPDASMTDIIPMLDELHPLLHSEAQSRGIAESDAASERPHSSSSSDEGMESDVNSESHEEEGENENEEDEQEEEEKKQEKEDESKSAIKWTEADQKNVMDLGSLELERNQRLENLIARRRARHNMRLMSERNLIDFDSADIPFNMQPISTARQNPFEFPYDSYDDMPIPGSAPSIMFARRNPFDLPYEPNEEKPNLKGDGFEEEFSSPQPKDPVFRRHESFSVGPSMLGGPRHDRLRPFFVLERLAHERTSYYPFERQLSEVSESKVSSVLDTESVCTILEDDEKKVDEHNNADQETEIANVDIASENDEEKSHLASDNDEEICQPASDHDEEKCLSASEHEGSDFDEQADSKNHHHDVPEIILGIGETQHEQSKMMEGETSDMRKHDEEDSSDSDSSLSEKVEEIPDISENESMLILELKVDLHEESDTSQPSSFGGVEIHVGSGMDDGYQAPAEDSFITEESAINDLCGLVDNHHEEPVYDSSPASASRFPSFSSVSSDYKPDLPGKNGEEVQERNVYSESIGPTETSTREVGDTSTHVPGEASLPIAEIEPDGQNNPTVSRSELLDPSSLPLDKNENVDHDKDDPSQENLEVSVSMVDLVSPTEEKVISTRMLEQNLPVENTREHVTTLEESPDVVHDIIETSANRSSVAEEIIHKEEEEEEECKLKDEANPQTFNAHIPIDNSTLSSGAVETHSFNDEYVPQLEQDPVHSSISDANQTMDIQVDSVNASAQNVGSEETPPSETDRELTWSDKSVVEQSSVEAVEDQVPTRAGPVSVVFSRNITFHEYHDAPEDADELSCLTSDTSSTPAESPEYKTPMVGESSRAEFFQEAVYDNVVEQLDELTDLRAISQSPPEVINEEADDIKEIDEGLLSELDTIGDFSVKEVMTDSEPGPSSIGSDTTNKEDIESAFQQIHEVDDTVQDQENYGNSTETKSDLAVVEATSKENLVNSMNEAVVESMGKQPKSPESDGVSTEIKCAVETEASESSVVERSLDEANVPLNNTPKKEEEDMTTSDVSSIKTRSLEEIPRPSEPKEGMAVEVTYERVVNPTEAIESSDITLSDDVVAEEAKAETASKADANVQTSDSKELGDSIAEQKAKMEKKKQKSKSNSSSSSSSSSSSDSD